MSRAASDTDASVNKSQEEKESSTKGEDRSSLLKIIGKAIGLDITKIAIPVKYNEPFSFLQKMMEYLQYTDLLEEASSAEDPKVRALLVAIFSISCFSNTSRTVKPFNPLLGETFEFEDNSKQLRFIAEQVSHHPPIGASHCETPNFIYHQTQTVKTKFLGNSLDVTPTGESNVILKKWDECYSWSNIKTVVNNLVIGKMWIDHYGKSAITVRKNSTKEVLPIKVELNYKKCGWFGRGWRDVEGKVFSSEKKQNYFIFNGKWNGEICATADPSISKSLTYKTIKFADNNPHLIWKHECKACCEKGFSNFDWTEFTEKLIKTDDQLRLGLPCSDSRLREDRISLEKGDIKSSSKHKNALEDAQRSRRKSLESSKSQYKPRYFDLINSKENIYVYNGKYWTERTKRVEENLKNNKKTTIEDAKNFWLQKSHQSWCNSTL